MPAQYQSIFDGNHLITKKDLCELLNLDLSRPGYNFSREEITKAWRIRSLRFHPDKQSILKPSIPVKLCEQLMKDITRAKEHLLKGEDNIPGANFLGKDANLDEILKGDWFKYLLDSLNGFKGESISSKVSLLSYCTSDFLLMAVFATYSDDKLNLRFINQLSEHLNAIRPYAQIINKNNVIRILRILQRGFKKIDEVDMENIKLELNEVLPASITEKPEYSELLTALHNAGAAIKKLLTNEFINNFASIIAFLPEFIANFPTWHHIFYVYFTSLLFTASTLPRFINAYLVIEQLIWLQKGSLTFVLSAIPLFLLTAIMLPLNFIVQFTLQLGWVVLKALPKALSDCFLLLVALFNLIPPHIHYSYQQAGFALFEHSFNLTIRLFINLSIEALDIVINILTSQSLLSSLQEYVNTFIDDELNRLRPSPMRDVANESPLAVGANSESQEPGQRTPAQASSFFSQVRQPLHNKEDKWLAEFINTYVEVEPAENNVNAMN